MVMFLLVRNLHEAIFPKIPFICLFLSLELAQLLSGGHFTRSSQNNIFQIYTMN